MIKLCGTLVLSYAIILSGTVTGTTFYQKSEDLETSASGYSYQARSSSPADKKSDYEKAFEEFKYGPTVGRYSDDPVPLDQLPLSPNFKSSADSYGSPYAKGYEKFLDDDSNRFTNDYNFVKGGGSGYLDRQSSGAGEKLASAYSDSDGFAKGLRGRHEKDSTNRFFDVLGGRQKGHAEDASRYSKNRQAVRADKGGSFASEQSHDKGSKTTGYQKVYHKDEYKKDHSFYDKQNNKGHFNRYGNFDAAAASDAGASAKGHNSDAAFEAGKYGARGLSDKGRFLDEASGYKGAEGDHKYHRDGTAYANKEGKSLGIVKGYSEGDKFGEYAVDA